MKYMHCHITKLVVFFGLFFLGNSVESFGGEHIAFLTPVENGLSQQESIPQLHENEPHLNRTGRVQINVDLLASLLSSESEQRVASADVQYNKLSISFFPGQSYSVEISSSTKLINEVVSIQGIVDGADISSYTMTLASDSYALTLQDLQTTLLYRVIGNRSTGIGTVQEFDLQKLPPVYDSDPVVPPMGR